MKEKEEQKHIPSELDTGTEPYNDLSINLTNRSSMAESEQSALDHSYTAGNSAYAPSINSDESESYRSGTLATGSMFQPQEDNEFSTDEEGVVDYLKPWSQHRPWIHPKK